MKINNLRIKSALLALMMTTSLALVKPADVKAEENNIIENVETVDFIAENNEQEANQYSLYTVQKGDNASVISKKISRECYGIPSTTKYWPVIAFLNNYPRAIKEGDYIFYPTEIEHADYVLDCLKKSGWINKYVKLNRIYQDRSKPVTVSRIIDEIYGKGVSANQEFVDAYLKIVGFEGFDKDAIITNNDIYFMITEYIPTVEEIQNVNKKTK